MDAKQLKPRLMEKMVQLKEKGYAYFDLLEMGYFTKDELLRMQKLCMDHYYQFFLDRGLTMNDIQIDLTKKSSNNAYFKQPKDSKMFKAMYGQVSKTGKEYINCRAPANAMGCGMGRATSEPAVYLDSELNIFSESLRPLYNAIYQSPTKRHLTRFGLKLPYSKSKDMVAHVDMSYCKKYRNNPPKTRDPDDPISLAPYLACGRPVRIQTVLGLSDSAAGWYGYEGAHTKYAEIGDALGWPGIKHSPQPVPVDLLEKKLGLTRVDIPTKLGRMIIWNCGIVHGNSACKDTTPRLVRYINFQADKEDSVATNIFGLGNQPKLKMNM